MGRDLGRSDEHGVRQFAVFAPWMAKGGRWILFCDFADMLFLADPAELFDLADERYAVQVVKGRHVPDETVKMDGQAQTTYRAKELVQRDTVELPASRHGPADAGDGQQPSGPGSAPLLLA